MRGTMAAGVFFPAGAAMIAHAQVTLTGVARDFEELRPNVAGAQSRLRYAAR